MPVADTGLLAAIILAGGVTSVVAIAMMIVRQRRSAQLTIGRGVLSVTLGLGMLALAGLGVVAVSPVSAEAQTSVVSSTTNAVDLQLPTK